MFYNTRVAMRFPAKISSSCIWVAIPVGWVILHWYACGADGRSVGRCTVTWLPNFLGWVDYHIFLPMVLRCARFARESPAKKKDLLPKRNRTPLAILAWSTRCVRDKIINSLRENYLHILSFHMTSPKFKLRNYPFFWVSTFMWY